MYLGLDLGTTNVKAVVVEPGGAVVARGAAPVRLLHVGEGGVEQDIEEIFAATRSAVSAAVAPGHGPKVRAVGVASQGGALQMLDGDDRPVGRVISWLDARGRSRDRALTAEMGAEALAARTGHPRGTMAMGQLLRLRDECPSLLAEPNRVGFVGDVIVGRLCGRRAHDASSLSCAVLYNPTLASADPVMLARVGLSAGQLPDLLSVRASAGGLLEAVAAETSLPAGIPVAPAVHDQYAAALGVGAVAPGDVMFGAGTAWAMLAVSGTLMPPLGGAGFCCTHVVDGAFGHIVSLGNGGSSITWALALLGKAGLDAAGIDRMLASAGAGAGGVRFWPFLAPTGGAGLTGDLAGRLTGLKLPHGPDHVLRAVVEGLALEFARYLRVLAGTGQSVDRLIMTGGGAASEITPRIVADATDLPVACAVEPDTGALGAAMMARGLLERDTPLADISREMAPRARPFAPGKDAGTYAKLLEEYIASLPTV